MEEEEEGEGEEERLFEGCRGTEVDRQEKWKEQKSDKVRLGWEGT